MLLSRNSSKLCKYMFKQHFLFVLENRQKINRQDRQEITINEKNTKINYGYSFKFQMSNTNSDLKNNVKRPPASINSDKKSRHEHF